MSDKNKLSETQEDTIRGTSETMPQRKKRIGILTVITTFVLVLIVSLILYPFQLKLELLGDTQFTMEVGTLYEEPGFTAFYSNDDVSQSVIISGEIDSETLGTYTISYTYKTSGKFNKTVKRTVEVVDTTPAQISLIGGEQTVVILNSTYTEFGYTATDNYDGDLTDQVTVTSNVDSAAVGMYEVLYTVSDSSGNITEVTRYVEVTDRDPLSASLADYSLDGFFTNATLHETPDGGDAYINDTIFIGDSIIGNMGYYYFVPIETIWTRSSLTPENVWTREINVYHGDSYGTILDNIKVYQPKRIILTIGVSGSGWMGSEYFMLKYKQFVEEIQRLSPETQIIIGSILPIDKRYDTDEDGFSNKKINILNYYIAQMCEEYNIKFLNMAPVMKDENGQAAAGMTYKSDGIHPTDAAYEKLIVFIRTHTYQE